MPVNSGTYCMRPWYLVHHRSQDDVSVGNLAILASLQIKRTGLGFVAVEGAARDAGYLLLIDDRGAVLNHGDPASHKRNVIALPLARFARHLRRRRDETIHATRVMTGRLLNRIILHLQ